MAENKEEAKKRARLSIAGIAERRRVNRLAVSTDDPSITDKSGSATDDIDFKEDVTTETFLHLLDPDLPMPRLAVSPHMVEMRHIHPGKKSTAQVEVRNETRGCVHGRAILEDATPGLSLESEEFFLHRLKGKESVKLTVIADTSQALYGSAKLRILAFRGAFKGDPDAKSYMDVPVSFSSTFPYPLLYPWVALLLGGLVYLLIVIFTGRSSAVPLTPDRSFYIHVFSNIKHAFEFHQYSLLKSIPLNNNIRTYACAPIYFLFCIWMYSTRRFRDILSKTWTGVNSAIRSLWGTMSSNANSGISSGSNNLYQIELVWVFLALCFYLTLILFFFSVTIWLYLTWFIFALMPFFILMGVCYLLGGALLTTLGISGFLGLIVGIYLRKALKFPETHGVARTDAIAKNTLLAGICLLFTLNVLIASGVI